MNQEKFGEVIKEIRKKHGLTQKQLADKLNVSYQAVSKWENGKNMPDTLLINKISKQFNISINEMFEGNINIHKFNWKKLLIVMSIFIILVLGIVYIINVQSNFKFKTITSNCENFNISGSIAYNDKKTSIYITNIQYCGENDKEEYQEIECVLYEHNFNLEKRISSYKDSNSNITLEDFLKNVTLAVDDYKKTCKEYSENSLFLSINAKKKDGKIINYKVPLLLEEKCLNN